MSVSKASAQWQGAFKEGKGTMTPAHAHPITFSAGTRFEGVDGSNPEELVGAALAGCFSMALSVGLGKAGFTPTSLNTTADVKLERGAEGFSITQIALQLRADVPGIEKAQLEQIAQDTKKGCPVSKALTGTEITLTIA